MTETTTWHVLPAEPSEDMIHAIRDYADADPLDAGSLYKALLEASPAPPADGAVEICVERIRQITELGYLPETDDAYDKGQLLQAAYCYFLAANVPLGAAMTPPPPQWPWDVKYWRPRSQRRNLVRAGALLAAELDRQTRVKQRAMRMHEKANRK